jgi:hypothetical protein
MFATWVPVNTSCPKVWVTPLSLSLSVDVCEGLIGVNLGAVGGFPGWTAGGGREPFDNASVGSACIGFTSRGPF